MVVVGRSGECAGGSYRYAVTIRNGIVSYGGGDADISGRVNAKGGVYVRVSAGGQNAAGSGRLSRQSRWRLVAWAIRVRGLCRQLERLPHGRLRRATSRGRKIAGSSRAG